MGKIIIQTNEDFKMNNDLEELIQIQRLLIKYEVEKGLKFTAGITNSNKLKVIVFYKDLDNAFKFKHELEKLINGEESYTFRISVGYE